MPITFLKDQSGNFTAQGVGEMGTWIDVQTGLGYSGPKKKATDIPYQGQVGSTQTLNRNPEKSVPAAKTVAPSIIPQTAGGNVNQRGLATSGATSGTEVQDPMTIFNTAILDMLKRSQVLSGQEGALTNQRALDRAAIERGSDLSSVSNLRPSDMVSALQNRENLQAPEQDAIAVAMKAQDNRITNFESILGTLRDMGQDFIKLNPSQEIVSGYINMVRAGADFTSIPSEIRNKVISKMTDDDWTANSQAKISQKRAETAAGQTAPSSVQEYQYYSAQEKAAGKTPMSYYDFSNSSTKGKALTGSMATTLSEGKQIPLVTSGISDWIENSPQLFGPVAGRLGGVNPYDVEAQKAQADLKRAAQVVGKFMEGGVLRKEDEEKYAQMLPQLTDLPVVAKDKLTKVVKLLQDKSNQYITDYGLAGYDVSGFQSLTTQLSSGDYEIPVEIISTGETGWILKSEFDPSIYKQLTQ